MRLTSGEEFLVLLSSVNRPPSKADANNNFLGESGLDLISSVG
jgi:hypothetical protein